MKFFLNFEISSILCKNYSFKFFLHTLSNFLSILFFATLVKKNVFRVKFSRWDILHIDPYIRYKVYRKLKNTYNRYMGACTNIERHKSTLLSEKFFSELNNITNKLIDIFAVKLAKANWGQNIWYRGVWKFIAIFLPVLSKIPIYKYNVIHQIWYWSCRSWDIKFHPK